MILYKKRLNYRGLLFVLLLIPVLALFIHVPRDLLAVLFYSVILPFIIIASILALIPKR